MSISSLKDLKKLKQNGLSSLEPGKTKVKVGLASCGKAAGGDKVFDTLEESLAENDNILVEKTGCLGFCAREPLVEVTYPEGNSLVYQNVTSDEAKTIADHLKNNKLFTNGILGKREGSNGENKALSEFADLESLDFYKNQQKVVLRNSGIIDPEKLEEYVARKGYFGLWNVLTTLTPTEVIDEIKESGLRGRGGAGFPTGVKWGFAQKSEGDQKYIICNADEGDPGAYMDRSVLEGDPFSVLEGMTIGAYAIGASKGYIYIRAEYPVAIRRLEKAIKQAEESGLLGKTSWDRTSTSLWRSRKEPALSYVVKKLL